eukprot:TRINITY_DN16157_c0_g1_i1.p1 TRINITY_DN16157_c0_g1~~TRINITY_DN16157_c0_g1_i1.p1  ORF type:complete len:214 (+),score=19.65 TRINITY_DN16157_c0_g1_i1:122-763(+)
MVVFAFILLCYSLQIALSSQQSLLQEYSELDPNDFCNYDNCKLCTDDTSCRWCTHQEKSAGCIVWWDVMSKCTEKLEVCDQRPCATDNDDCFRCISDHGEYKRSCIYCGGSKTCIPSDGYLSWSETSCEENVYDSKLACDIKVFEDYYVYGFFGIVICFLSFIFLTQYSGRLRKARRPMFANGERVDQKRRHMLIATSKSAKGGYYVMIPQFL